MSDQPVKLTEEQLKNRTAQHLLTLLEEVSADGKLTDAEVFSLNEWLALHDDPAISGLLHLRKLVRDAVADGVISDLERHEIIATILRIMPDEIARVAILHFGSMSENPDWRIGHHPATGCQKRMMAELGISIPDGCTRAEAASLIAQVGNAGPGLASLHMMVLRFWGREDLKDYMKEACAWLDKWYDDDPDRYKAWRLWRKEHPDCCHPEGVAEGVGNRYLEKVKS
jgi:hypothetical protein